MTRPNITKPITDIDALTPADISFQLDHRAEHWAIRVLRHVNDVTFVVGGEVCPVLDDGRRARWGKRQFVGYEYSDVVKALRSGLGALLRAEERT